MGAYLICLCTRPGLQHNIIGNILRTHIDEESLMKGNEARRVSHRPMSGWLSSVMSIFNEEEHCEASQSMFLENGTLQDVEA